MSECDREASIIMSSCPPWGLSTHEKKKPIFAVTYEAKLQFTFYHALAKYVIKNTKFSGLKSVQKEVGFMTFLLN